MGQIRSTSWILNKVLLECGCPNSLTYHLTGALHDGDRLDTMTVTMWPVGIIFTIWSSAETVCCSLAWRCLLHAKYRYVHSFGIQNAIGKKKKKNPSKIKVEHLPNPPNPKIIEKSNLIHHQPQLTSRHALQSPSSILERHTVPPHP